MSIDELRAELARLAGSVVPDEDPYGQLLRRSRRRQRVRLAGLSTAMASLLAVVLMGPVVLGTGSGGLGGWLGGRPFGNGYPVDSEWTWRLIESPTRGNLSGDTALVSELARAFDAARGEVRMDRSMPKVKVLFAHDFTGSRSVVVAYYSNTTAGLVSRTARRGASAGVLVSADGMSNARINPFTIVGESLESAQGWSSRWLLGLAPTGCTVATSRAATIEPNGTARRTWVPAPTRDFLIREESEADELWQVRCDGIVRQQGTAGFHDVEVIAGKVTTEAPPISGEVGGEVDDTTARAALATYRALVAAVGIAAGQPVVLWGGTISGDERSQTAVLIGPADRPGPVVLQIGQNRKAIVALTTSDNSGPDDTETMGAERTDWSLVSPAIATSATLVAVRVPERADGHAALTSRLLVLGPPDAVSVEAINAAGTPVQSGLLTKGVGVISLPVGATVTLRALDATGETVGSAPLQEQTQGKHLFGEEIVSRW